MAEYIEREALMKELSESVEPFNTGSVFRTIRKQPAADVAPVVHGRWKQCFEDWRQQIEGDKCSACGFEHYGTSINHYHYCPNCGAKMDGGDLCLGAACTGCIGKSRQIAAHHFVAYAVSR